MSNQIAQAKAVLINAIVAQDGKVSEKEKKKFVRYFNTEYQLSTEECEALFEKTLKEKEYQSAILLLQSELTAMQKYRFLQLLNEVVISDGIAEEEYALFEELKGALL